MTFVFPPLYVVYLVGVFLYLVIGFCKICGELVASALPLILSLAALAVVWALVITLTHGWAILVFFGLVYSFGIFWACRWAVIKWSRRKLPKLPGDGDISYFRG